MKGALLLLAAAIVGAAGCTDNDLSLSIVQMEALTQDTMCIATSTQGGVAIATGTLDVSFGVGYTAVPLVRNNLQPRAIAGGVEFNAVQLQGANVKLMTTAGAPLPLPSGQIEVFRASAGGRLDPNGLGSMFIEAIPSDEAAALAGRIPSGGAYTVIAEMRPVGMKANDQVIGGPIDFPINLCNGCLRSSLACPLPKDLPLVTPCFIGQDVRGTCCTTAGGQYLCDATAKIAM
jgi:hypothetical protein